MDANLAHQHGFSGMGNSSDVFPLENRWLVLHDLHSRKGTLKGWQATLGSVLSSLHANGCRWDSCSTHCSTPPQHAELANPQSMGMFKDSMWERMRLTKMPAEYLWLHMHKRIAAFICRYTMYGHFWPAILDTPHYGRDMTRPLQFVLRPPSSAPDRHHCAAMLFSTAIGPTEPLQCPCRPKTDASSPVSRWILRDGSAGKADWQSSL